MGCGSKPKIDFKVEVRPVVSIQVSPGGSVTSASIVRSSGQSRLDRAALDFARSCRFTDSPNGRAGKIAVSFVQEGSQQEREAQERAEQQERERQQNLEQQRQAEQEAQEQAEQARQRQLEQERQAERERQRQLEQERQAEREAQQQAEPNNNPPELLQPKEGEEMPELLAPES